MRTEKASSTAMLIALATLILGRERLDPELVPRESRILCSWILRNYSLFTRALAASVEIPGASFAAHLIESLTVPAIIEHFALRKLAITRACSTIARCEHLVVLGAGFDSLSFRMAKSVPGAIIEVDHPATQAWKIQAAKASFPDHRVQFIASDLSSSLARIPILDQSTTWVAEGLLMYLDERQVVELLQAVRKHSPPGSKVLFTYLEPQPGGRVDFRRQSRSVRAWLANRREPFAWGIRSENLSPFLSGIGFRTVEVPHETTREMTTLDVGEKLALAEIC